jgi:Na+-transporting NADH:ubiquinone oxidoreductase subunit NqrC|tara:strand:- start:201 stop:929 length:729 start_codon:yes stop_codon:yes gene_type:complete
MLGNHHSIDDKGLTTVIIIIPTSILFGVISFIVGLTLSLKRKERKDFDYNLKYMLLVATIISIILFVILFYNPTMRKMAIAFEDQNLCQATIITSNSYMFAPTFYSNCMMKVGIAKKDTKICDDVCDEKHVDKQHCEMNDQSVCYYNVARQKTDVELCAKSFSTPSHCVMTIAQDTKNIQLCEYLEGGNNQREEFSGTFGRDYCLSTMAPIMKSIEVCNLIKIQETKDHCIENFDNPKNYID